VYAAATAVFGRVVGLPWPVIRIVAAVVLAASVPVLAAVTPMWALVIVVALLGAMVAVEAARNRTAA
jgi:hypothetical protein